MIAMLLPVTVFAAGKDHKFHFTGSQGGGTNV